MVLLLRESHFFDAAEIRVAAEKAWGTSFAEDENAQNYVVQSGHVVLLKTGPHLLNFLNHSEPYLVAIL